ncbi:MAG TPA: CoA transferase [Solirubrobacteraceae bacterium]
MIELCWSAVGGDPQAPSQLEVVERDAWLGGPLAVDELALGSVAAALLAAAELSEARTGSRPTIALSGEHVALSFHSERNILRNGSPAGSGFAPLSRFLRCAAGSWARTHGNYPHHAAALAAALGFDLAAQDPVAALQEAAEAVTAIELEDAVFAAGGCATALRSPQDWAAHPAGRTARDRPLIAWDRSVVGRLERQLPQCDLRAGPASGVRVLDLTRVIAGPVAGRTLAALGAEVLRIDPPHLPELPAQHLDTGPGKRSAFLDLADAETREPLLAGAHVLLTGYRPHALARFDMSSEALAERHPHLVQVSLSAWGADGPWANRRGFDSLVQVACGIASVCSTPDGTPGALPAQALDHASGHLIAATALRALALLVRGEQASPASLALATTGAALLDAPAPPAITTEATGKADPRRHRVRFADLELIAPPGTLDRVPLHWPHRPRPLGGDAPSWN